MAAYAASWAILDYSVAPAAASIAASGVAIVSSAYEISNALCAA